VIIVQTLAMPGTMADDPIFPQLAQIQAQELTGDKASGSKANRFPLAVLGTNPSLQPRPLDPDGPASPGRTAPGSTQSSPKKPA
jgi:hypothetical protein